MARTGNPADANDRLVTAKVPRRLDERLRAEARESSRSLSGQIRFVLKQWVDAQPQAATPRTGEAR